MDTKGGSLEDVWIRPGTEKTTKARSARSASSENEGNALVKRQPNDCFDPDQLQKWYGDINW